MKFELAWRHDKKAIAIVDDILYAHDSKGRHKERSITSPELWCIVEPTLTHIKDKFNENKDWNKLLFQFEDDLKTFQYGSTNYLAFMGAVEITINGIAPAKFREHFAKEMKKMEKKWTEGITKNLKEIYLGYMVEATEEDIETPEEMFGLLANGKDAGEFFNEVIEPICEALALTAPHYHAMPSQTFEQSPNYAGVEELFAQALRVHSEVRKTDADNNKRVAFLESDYDDREKYDADHPSPKERKNLIIYEISQFARMGFKIKLGLFSEDKLPREIENIMKRFVKFLEKKSDRRFGRS